MSISLRIALCLGLYFAATSSLSAQTTSLTSAVVQALLSQSQNGFAGLALTANSSCSDDQSLCYDVQSDSTNLNDCTITVDRNSSSQVTWFCTIFEGSAQDMDQAWAQASQQLHNDLSGWTFASISSRRLVAIEPGSTGRKIYIDGLARTITLGCIVTNGNVRQP
jgi:hypothetical protein